MWDLKICHGHSFHILQNSAYYSVLYKKVVDKTSLNNGITYYNPITFIGNFIGFYHTPLGHKVCLKGRWTVMQYVTTLYDRI
jgi:hypothetical protein